MHWSFSDGLVNLCSAYRSSTEENKEKILSLLVTHVKSEVTECRYIANYYSLRFVTTLHDSQGADSFHLAVYYRDTSTWWQAMTTAHKSKMKPIEDSTRLSLRAMEFLWSLRLKSPGLILQVSGLIYISLFYLPRAFSGLFVDAPRASSVRPSNDFFFWSRVN